MNESIDQPSQGRSLVHNQCVGRLVSKSTLWTLRKASTRIILSMPHRRTRIYTFHLLWIFCFRNHYSIYPTLDGMCRPDQSADSAGWSGRYITQMCIAAAAFWGIFRKNCIGTCLQCLKGATPLQVTESLWSVKSPLFAWRRLYDIATQQLCRIWLDDSVSYGLT